MSDLKSWNILTIQGELDADTVTDLPTFGLHDGDAWEATAERDGYTMSGWYHCTPFEVGEWAQMLTEARPGTTVTWYEEFRMDDVGESETVYRAGELVPEESKVAHMVPITMPDMLTKAKTALEEYAARDPLQSLTQHQASHAPALYWALEAIVKGLT